ncbi:Scr1 family TA system antitoxin-like transcriptional regulator [Streptomyces sp. NPDC088354]|uniref:helix-turn-helix domain-containing protein n=1 Tax=Streptomyces sp. NPDC088354 TaxID=3365856 RepID=UPI0038273905
MPATKGEGSASMRMFGSVARSLREARGLTTDELAARVGYSKSLVVKIERGERMPPPAFVESAEALLGDAGGVLRAAARHLERGEFPSWFEEYAELERAAACLYKYDAHVINGLLQTEDYARVVLGAHCPTLEADEVERRVRARLARQSLLTRAPAPQLAFVIEEWVLRRPVGGREVNRRQLERLLEAGALRNVTVQVMPLPHEAHAGFDGPMTLLETPDLRLLAYLEVQGRSVLVDQRNEVSKLNQRYAMIRSQALSVGDSAKVIEQIAGEL